jgi:hypothetical protein
VHGPPAPGDRSHGRLRRARDLLRLAETSDFEEMHLELRADVQRPEPKPWQAWLHSSGNPRIPNIAEAMDRTLTRDEPDRLSAQLRPKSSKGPDDNDARRRLPVGHPTSRIGPGGAHVPRA